MTLTPGVAVFSTLMADIDTQSGVGNESLGFAGVPGILAPLGTIALILIGWMALMRRRRA
jgi:hypothetical protein